ncbi:sigma-54-dependent Fis family transcriptional regulator [Candidatus Poribacteria bacterium]|nr:sigma-54-dependent Fis family transcriptional regulator [Candidatus Poribacteria bacterium]
MSDNNRPKVLIVDDVSANINILFDTLEPEGYKILGASNGKDALRIATSVLPDIILLDIVMPEMDGYEVCRQLKQNPSTQHIPVIFITAVRNDNASLIEGFRVGGVDYVIKPFCKEELLVRIETHLKLGRLMREILQKNRELQEEIEGREQAEKRRKQAEIARRDAEKVRKQAEAALQEADERLSILSQQEASRWGIDAFIGKSNTIKKMLNEVRQLQNASKTGVLIMGESGTGKELIARAIHFGGERAKGPFIPVNCSAIPSELVESTLFGHVRGAFTGANTSRKGYFELASGGTLFLDEIGDMPIELQPKLLRVIEDGCVVPVGGAQQKHVDVRILAATNQDLQTKIAIGTFREALYFRLARFTVIVPPLREHKEDITLLAKHFLNIFAEEMGIEHPAINSEAMNALVAYHFPGNVRELKNIIEHALILSGRSELQPEHLRFIEAAKSISAHPTTIPNDLQHIQELVIKRSQVQSPKNDLETDEEKILAYLREHSSISNIECQHLLNVDIRRASYLLNKMYGYGLLVRDGGRRWSRYRIQT